jgi:hypothetical protein
MGDRRVAHRIFVGRPDGKRLLGGPRLREEDNIAMDLQCLEWGGMYWIVLA